MQEPGIRAGREDGQQTVFPVGDCDKKGKEQQEYKELNAMTTLIGLRRTVIFKKGYVNKMHQLMPEEKFDGIMEIFKGERKKS